MNKTLIALLAAASVFAFGSARQRNFLSVNPRRAIWLGKGDHACKLR